MTPQELRRIFDAKVAPGLFAGVETRSDAQIIFLGGQPGAGKSRAADVLRDMHGQLDIVAIVGDDFRRYHPDHDRVLRQDPTRLPEVTAAAAGAWTAMAVSYGLDNGMDLLIEGTWRDETAVLNTALMARTQGYATHAAVVAVPPLVSLVSTLTRFYDAEPMQARWTPVDAHENVVATLPLSVQHVAASEMIDRFTVLDRAGNTHLDEHGAQRGIQELNRGLAVELSERGRRAREAHGSVFSRSLTTPEIADMLTTVRLLLQDHQARTLTAPAADHSWRRVAQMLEDIDPKAPNLHEVRTRIERSRSISREHSANTARPGSFREALDRRVAELRAERDAATPPMHPPNGLGHDRGPSR